MRSVIYFVIVCSVWIATDARATTRIWTSTAGTQIEAALVWVIGDRVHLKTTDGRELTIEQSKLSSADRAFIQAHEDGRETAAGQAGSPPEKWILKSVPMVVQDHNYCVPASAAMIAGFHEVETTQQEIAALTSAGSSASQGTYPADMALAMEKLGFTTESHLWQLGRDEVTRFKSDLLPLIRNALYQKGPIYVSLKPGVFGDGGHGCVIVGYDDRRERLYLHNPWGNAFETAYEDFCSDARGIVIVHPPQDVAPADEAYLERIRASLPQCPTQFAAVLQQLERNDIPYRLVWCNRRDERLEKRFAEQTARDQGRKILELAFRRSPAVILPHCEDGQFAGLYLVTEPDAGAQFPARYLDARGWHAAETYTLGSFARVWALRLPNPEDPDVPLWELPLIELQPFD